jgi:hypothetical protein
MNVSPITVSGMPRVLPVEELKVAFKYMPDIISWD